MKSNKDYTDGLPGRLRKILSAVKSRVSLKELPILRLSDSLFGKSVSKKKLLKEKYSSRRKQGLEETPPITQTFTVETPTEQIQKKIPFIQHFNKKVVIVTACTLLIGGVMVNLDRGVDAYAVKVNGTRIATVAEKADAEKAVEQLKKEKTRLWKRKVDVEQKLTLEKEKAKKYQIDSRITVKNRLNKTLTFVALATGIKVDGQVAVVVKDTQTAENVLTSVKDSYQTDDFKVNNIYFEEKVELVEVPSSLKNVLTAEKAVEQLKGGKQEKKVHVVEEGDSLWTIARENDMHIEDLIKMNPSLSEHLDLGQEINLVSVKPLLDVVVTGEKSSEQAVPYKTVVQTDSSMMRGREKVKNAGEKGLKKTTYKLVMKNGQLVTRTLVDEKLIKAAQDRVVVKGKKYMVASRSTGGRVSWPIYGRITSPFGGRSRGFHTGIDIDGVTGQPVGAAADGVVITAGRDGGYGNMVLIRHNNGLVTRYAHLSKILVSSGQEVSRGEVIGRVGSTGNSTGSHLHFEVISGGSTLNPMKFLR